MCSNGFLKGATVIGLSLLASVLFASDLKSEKDQVSYIIGYQVGKNLARQGAEIDTTIFVNALKDAMDSKKSQFSPEESQKIMMAYSEKAQKKMAEKQKVEGEKNLKVGKDFLAENAKKPGVVTLPSGLQYKVITEGKGTSPKATDTVSVNYRGTLIDGTEFDSSYKRNQPATFPVNGVIKGWTEALQLMKPGAKWNLFIPASLAYGERGPGDSIGPNSTLLFEVELLSVQAEKKEEAKKEGTKKPTVGKK